MGLDKESTTELNLAIEVGIYKEAMLNRPGYYSGVRPNHRIPGKSYFFMGEIHFLDRELLKPGDKCLANCRMIIAESDLDLFVEGFTWEISEVYKVTGYAKVVQRSIT